MWRSLDVDALVRDRRFGDARVVAGSRGLDRVVERARLARTAEHLGHLSAGDLVITDAGTVAAAGATAGPLVPRLDAAGAAGLVVHLDDGRESVPAPILEAADRFDLPVVALAPDADLAAVAATIADAVLDTQRSRLDGILDVHHRFTQIVLAGGGLPEVAAELHDLLECTVAVVDVAGELLVLVPPDAPEPDRLGAGEAVREPIRAGGQEYGTIIAVGPGEASRTDAPMVLERAAMAIAMRQAQAAAVAESEERFAAVTLEQLVSGHVGGAIEVIERAATFGWDLARPRAVLLASIDPPASRDVVIPALATIAGAARATLGPEAIVWQRTATIAALVAPDTGDAAVRRAIAEDLRRELDVRLRSVTVSIGVGRRVSDPTELAQSFVEAKQAVDVGRWAKGRHVTEVYDDLGLERLLAATPQADLADFVHHTIGSLVDHDRRNGSELVETLAVWLETRNIAETARRMHVHYNTLKNRLERVEAILGPVLGDAERALECEVAIHVARHYDVPGMERPLR